MIEEAVELLAELQLMYMNKEYLSTSEQELNSRLETFWDEYYAQ